MVVGSVLAAHQIATPNVSMIMHSSENGADPSIGDRVPAANGRASVGMAGPTSVSVATVSTNHNVSGGTLRECAACGKLITERFLLKALDLFWHEDCLKCGCCDCRLGEVGSTLYTKANLILCKRDYLRLFGTTGYCAACNKVIPAFEMVMRAKSNVYHLECFACQQCNHRFCVGDRFYLCDNKILCEYDYEERLVFANMAYNPSSLAHIRRQVSNLQPAADNDSSPANNMVLNSLNLHCYSEKNHLVMVPVDRRQLPISPLASQTAPNSPIVTTTTSNHQQLLQPPPPPPPTLISHPSNQHANQHQNNQHQNNHRDDGSSGYGSPDSDTFEPMIAQMH